MGKTWEALERRLLLAGGDVDLTFGVKGIAAAPAAQRNDPSTALLVAPDGKLVALGMDSLGHLEFVRFAADGLLDTTFGSGGSGVVKTTAQTGQSEFVPSECAMDSSSGRIAASVGGHNFDTIAVFNADGSPDLGFNGTGQIEAPGDRSFTFAQIAYQSDGKLLVAGVGATDSNGKVDVSVRRYLPDGTRDMTFGTDARASITMPDAPKDIVIMPDGGFAVAGDYYHGTDVPGSYAVGDDITRFTRDGHFLWETPVVDFSDQLDRVASPQARQLVVAPDSSFWMTTAEENTDLSHISADGKHQLAALSFSDQGDFSPNTIEVDDEGQLLAISNAAGVVRFASDGTFDAAYNNGVIASPASIATGTVLVHQGDRAITSMGLLQLTRLQGGAGTPPSITLSARGSLLVHGDRNPNAIDLYPRSRDGRIVVRVRKLTYVAPGDGDVVRSFSPRQIKRIAIFAGFGADLVTIAPGYSRGCYINAGDGKNSVSGGDGNDFIVGGNNADTLLGNGGNDTIMGGDDNDVIQGGAGADLLYGNDGQDLLRGNGGNDRLVGGEAGDFLPYDEMDGGAGFDRALVGPSDPAPTNVELVVHDTVPSS